MLGRQRAQYEKRSNVSGRGSLQNTAFDYNTWAVTLLILFWGLHTETKAKIKCLARQAMMGRNHSM